MHEYLFLPASSLTVRPVEAGYLPDLQATCCNSHYSHESHSFQCESRMGGGVSGGGHRWEMTVIAQEFPHPSINQILGENAPRLQLGLSVPVSAVPAGSLPATTQGPAYPAALLLLTSARGCHRGSCP